MSPDLPLGRRIGRRRPLILVGSAVTAVALVAALGTAAGAVGGRPPAARVVQRGTTAVRTAADNSCPTETYPTAASTAANPTPYTLAFSGTIHATFDLPQTALGVPITLPVAGTFCGLFQLPQETAIVQPQDFHFTPVTLDLGEARLPVTLVATGPSVATTAPTPAANGGLNLQLTAPVEAVATLFGIACGISPSGLTLTTGNSGALTGPLYAASASVGASNFTVGRVVGTGTSGVCPDFVANQVDTLIGLPIISPQLVGSVNLDVVIP